MKKTGTIKNKVFAGVIAAVCAVSVISTGAIIGASAFSSASSNADTAVIERRTSGSTFTLPMKGIDWNYFSDSLDVTVDCEIDFSRNLCNFRFTAIRPGAANITLQTKSTDGTWSNTPIRITVDRDLRMNIVQNGKATAANNDIKFTVDEDDTTTSSKVNLKNAITYMTQNLDNVMNNNNDQTKSKEIQKQLTDNKKRWKKLKEKLKQVEKNNNNSIKVEGGDEDSSQSLRFNSFNKIQLATRSTIEMEDMSGNILGDLNNQSSQMKNVSSKIGLINEDIDTSNNILTKMFSRQSRDKKIIIIFGLILLIAFLGTLTYKLIVKFK